MNYTANYHLPQWVETDRILMEDFNDMASTLDAALGGLREDVDTNDAAQTAALAAKGNCQIHFSTYVGGGTTSPKTMNFPAKPMLVMVTNPDGYCFVACRGMTRVYPHHSNGTTRVQLTWGTSSLTWNYDNYASSNMDEAGVTYQVAALLQQDA